MTKYQDAQDEERREQKRQRMATNRRRDKIWTRVVLTFSAIVCVAVIAFNVLLYTDRPRVEANVTQAVEDRGGKVIKIVHYAGRSRDAYAEVILDGETTRCYLPSLDEEPPVFDCDPDLSR